MLLKYDTRAAAIAAVKKDGKNLELTTLALRDDEEIVRTALKHGGSIEHASFRLRNSPELLLLHARSGVMEPVYERALFCAKMDITLIDSYCRLFMYNKEFNIELKLTYGARFRSSFKEYNNLSHDQLVQELKKIRMDHITYFRKIFKKTNVDIMPEIRDSKDLLFSLVRIPAVSFYYHNGSFSDVKNSFATVIAHNAREKDYYCSERGSGSFPERFMKALLDQLGIDYAREKVFEWSAGTGSNARMGQKRYDFYIPATSTIIEVHGAQHYDGGFENLGGRTLAEEQENDLLKAELAKQNGIKHYIVVNAVSSDFKFLRNSVSTNVDFSRCFDLAGVNWDAVYNGAIGKKETNQNFPYFDFCQKLYQQWYDLIEETETPADYIPVPRTYGAGYKDTKELMDNVAKAYPSTNGLYPHELMVLRYAPKYTYPVDPNDYSAKVFYDNYGIGDVKPYFDKLVVEGFLCVSDTRTVLQKNTVPTIKKFIADAGYAAQGRKGELIQYIIDNIPEEIINNAFPQKYYMLTDKGTCELEENKYLTEGTYWEMSIWEMNRREFSYRPRPSYHPLSQKENDAMEPKYSQSIPDVSRTNSPSVTPEKQKANPVPVQEPIPAVKPQIKIEEPTPTVQDICASFTQANGATESSIEKLAQEPVVQRMTQPETVVKVNVELPSVSMPNAELTFCGNMQPDAEPVEMECSDIEIPDTIETTNPSPDSEVIFHVVQPTVCDTEPSENKVDLKTSLHMATNGAGHVSEILSSKESECLMINKPTKPIKTRKVFIVLLVPFLFVTLLAITMALVFLPFFSVAWFFAIPSIMFAVLSRSPKSSKHLLGREWELKKSQFVLLCILAMIVVPIGLFILLTILLLSAIMLTYV